MFSISELYLAFFMLFATYALSSNAGLDSSASRQIYDACVIGGGAGGSSAAVFLKDRGYNVILLEKADTIGGHCNTVKVPNAPAGSLNTMELGVEVMVDTRGVNIALDGTPNGRFSVDLHAFLSRFVDSDNIGLSADVLPYSNSSNYIVDPKHSYSSGPLAGTGFDEAAFGTLYYLVFIKYPWLPTMNITGPIPDELLLPFDQFVALYNMSALYPTLFNSYLCGGGMCPYNQLVALYALHNLDSSLLSAVMGQAQLYRFRKGCVSIYQGITSYLGESNVLLNSHVTSVLRKKSQGKSISIVSGYRTDSSWNPRSPLVRSSEKNNPFANFEYQCRNVIVGFPQNLKTIKEIGLSLDENEKQLFGRLQVDNYVAGLIDVAGTVRSASFSYNMFVLNVTNTPSLQSEKFGLNMLQQMYPYAINKFYATLSPDAETSNLYPLMQSLIDEVVHTEKENTPGQFTSAQVAYINLHRFRSHPQSADINLNWEGKQTNFWNALRSLQGYRNTYWVGAVTNYAAHHYIIPETNDIISKHFPQRTAN